MDEIFHKKISVRGLVEFIFRSGDIRSGDGGAKDAMQEGTRIHKKIQSKMGENYEAEVSLKYDEITPDFILTIEGRADGILTEPEGVTIDEIKGVYKRLDLLEEPIYVHKAQAMCYAYMYARNENLSEIRVQLTYCNFDTEEIKRFRETFLFEELQQWFQQLVQSYCVWTQFEVNSRQKRNDSIKSLVFPFDYRDGQRDMAGSVYLAIKRRQTMYIQAPTGIGKTMATIFPTIKAVGEGYGEKVFYLTAKTIVRKVAVDALETLRNQNLYFRSVLITAKEKICPMEQMECEPEQCPYAKGHYDRINDAVYDCITHEWNITQEIILKYSNKHMVCPFEMELDVSLFADGIVCDYNYAFDPRVKLRRYFAEGAKGEYIFLVDEAHNLVERASAMYSAAIYKEDFLRMRRLLSPFHAKIGKLLGICNKELLTLKKLCDNEKGYVVITDISDLIFQLYRLLSFMGTFLEESKEIKELKQYQEEILDFYFKLNQFLNISELLDESYEIYAEQVDATSFMLKLFCIHPANNLAQCMEKANSTVFFSATMLPISYYKELLHNKEEDYAIYIPSPFSQKNRGLLVGTDVSSRYRVRGPVQYEKMARYLDCMVTSKRGNYMAFFPSYKMLQDVYEMVMQLGLLSECEIICQTANLSENERDAFLERFQEQENPVVGFCILGGIFSEGIDLVGERLIGVAIIGTGLPMVCNEREIQQNFFANRGRDGFLYAYLYPGMNKVQQAAGRVVRTMEDKGVILLLDDRFVSKQVVDTFPIEWSDYEIIQLHTVKQRLEQFWDGF